MSTSLFTALFLFAPLAVIVSASTADTPRTPKGEVRKLVTGFRFTEGPAWDAQGGVLIFSDIPANRLYHWDPSVPGETAVFRDPSGKANGNLFLPDGSLLSCLHGERSVVRVRRDGTSDVLASKFEGRPLNSPNDVAAKSDGTIWFTDPTYGLEGRPEEQSARGVYRLDPDGTLTRVATGFDQPNGITFSPDERLLYVADSGKPANIRVFEVSASNTLTGDRVFATITPGVPDGIRCDPRGRLLVAAGNGVQVFETDGRFVHLVPVPESPANLCLGGPGNRTLFITARTSLYSAPLPP